MQVVGKVKDKLLELEEQGVIEWNEETAQYTLVSSGSDIEFNLSEYLYETHKEIFDDD